jgi:hypothetical protein
MQERLSGRDCCRPCQHSKAYLLHHLGARPPWSDVAFEAILAFLGRPSREPIALHRLLYVEYLDGTFETAV